MKKPNKLDDFLKKVFTGGRKQGKQPGDPSTPASNTRKKMKRAAEAKAAEAKAKPAAKPAKKKEAPTPRPRADRPKVVSPTSHGQGDPPKLKTKPKQPSGGVTRGKKRPVEVTNLTGKVDDLPSKKKKKGIFADTFARTKYSSKGKK